MLPDHSPYGQALSIVVPPIRTLTFEPDASIVTFSLTIGPSHRHRGAPADAVVMPSSCPAGGFPFAAEFSYADGSSGRGMGMIGMRARARSSGGDVEVRAAPGGGVLIEVRVPLRNETHSHPVG